MLNPGGRIKVMSVLFALPRILLFLPQWAHCGVDLFDWLGSIEVLGRDFQYYSRALFSFLEVGRTNTTQSNGGIVEINCGGIGIYEVGIIIYRPFAITV